MDTTQIDARYLYQVRAANGRIKLNRYTLESADKTVARLRELGYADAYTHVGLA